MKKLQILLVLLVSFMLTGCMSLIVPANKLQIGNVKYTSRKNFALRDVTFYVDPAGQVNCRIGEITSINDPLVLDSAAAGQVAIMKELREMLKEAGEQGAKKAAGIP
jgi:hypothetical protein